MHRRSVVHAVFLALGCVVASAVAAEEPRVAWRTSGVLPAEEARQAAAAEGKFVYAIASTRIAKYDRQTGRRVAVSTGEAHHLNSGFFWEGRLLCAHSNYPQLPERSEIKVLDPESMEISTLKEFGNYGGSLTWVVRQQEHWWCFFARYGEHHGESFLVKFDDHWRQLKRWTLPPELLGDVGQYSLSGGVWREGMLLVTDHDHCVLYRLQVPDDAARLVLVQKQAAPFTGQGIAADPQTGGLVGINRGKRQVVFAISTSVKPGGLGEAE